MRRSLLSPSAFSRQGFTLIELLTVIAIIGILAAILIPVVGAVRSTAKNAQCVSNLRQIHMAMTLHADDNRLVVVYNQNAAQVHWVEQLRPYVTKALPSEGSLPDTVWGCPASDRPYTASSDSSRSHYGKNWIINGAANGTPPAGTPARFTLKSISNPSRVFFAADADQRDIQPWTAPITTRHGGRANVVFYDGHVGSFTVADMTPSYLNPPWQ
jgi:prepilin-type N-terminal cleavage/methylation domain-containing protein/prepilin-type processing-associated H-X9-DG protein